MILPQTDIHCHLLPGVDDGFKNYQESLEAIERMVGAGCKEFVFTPHMNPDVYPDSSEALLREAYDAFSSSIPPALGVKTALAAEYMVVEGFENRVSSGADFLTYPDGSILVEMSYYFRSANLEKVLFELNFAGYKPILAHPERYLYMADCLEDFAGFRDIGCRFQMNLASLTGVYGPDSVKILKFLMKKDMYDFVATDLHSRQQLDKILDGKPVNSLRRLYEQFVSAHDMAPKSETAGKCCFWNWILKRKNL